MDGEGVYVRLYDRGACSDMFISSHGQRARLRVRLSLDAPCATRGMAAADEEAGRAAVAAAPPPRRPLTMREVLGRRSGECTYATPCGEPCEPPSGDVAASGGDAAIVSPR